jgi:small subunit ribosomal protein S6e
MMLTISDPKNGKAYPAKTENVDAFIGKKIGDKVDLSAAGIEGYEAQIKGGSDKQGFPMKADLRGTGRKKIIITKDKKKGKKVKVTRRGNVVGNDIAQLNLAIMKYGSKPLDSLVTKPAKEEEKSAKEKMVKESLENVNKISAEEAKKVQEEMKKGKK